MPSSATAKTTSAGAKYYGALTLPFYDWAVLKTVVQQAWKCPLEKEQAMYDRSMGNRHLDVGVASGYFLHHAKHKANELVLMDLNPNSTKYAAQRLQSSYPKITQVTGDALNPFPVQGEFDSIGLFHLLHCIPGSLHGKSAVLRNAGKVLKPNGVVFGANVTPVDCPTSNCFAKSVLAFSHMAGALNNQHDRHADMEEILHQNFDDYHLERVGYMSLWEARSPKEEK